MWKCASIQCVEKRVRRKFALFRDVRAIQEALHPPCGHKDLDAVYRTPVATVHHNEHHNRWLLKLDEERTQKVLTRSALRFVPFPYANARPVIEYMEENDPWMEWMEMGQAGLLQCAVFTPPLWVLLRTTDYTDKDVAMFDVAVPVHYLYRKYRTALFIIINGDHTATLEQELEDDKPLDWMVEKDLDRAYELFVARAREQRQLIVAQHERERDMHRASVKDIPASREEFEKERAQRYADDPKTQQWVQRVEAIEDLAVARRQAEEALQQWEKNDAVLNDAEYVQRAPVDREHFGDFRDQAVKQRIEFRKKLQARLDRQRKVEEHWQRQLGSLFARHSSLLSGQRQAMRESVAAAKDDVQVHAALFFYTVSVINALEMMLMTLCRIPLNLRQSLQTAMLEPPSELVPNEVGKQCDAFASVTATKALEQRTLDGRSDKDPDWIFPPDTPDDLLSACHSVRDYERVLKWLLDNWKEAAPVDGTKAPAEE